MYCVGVLEVGLMGGYQIPNPGYGCCFDQEPGWVLEVTWRGKVVAVLI